MKSELLNPEIQKFITENAFSDINKLVLQKNPFQNVSWISIIQQIESKQKAKDKLPTWYNALNILYPPKISIEQTSSEKTAQYKASLISGNSLIDLTGGFGIDSYYFSKNFNSVTHCEINDELSELVKHNYKVLNIDNISCVSGNGLEILKNLNKKFDWIYIDPSRRNASKGKVFLLEDCEPNIIENLSVYYNYSDNLLVKVAPILDISLAIKQLKNIKKIHVVALENEVKELLFEIEKDFIDSIEIKTINLVSNINQVFEFNLSVDHYPNISDLKQYLYEPNSAILKSGGYNYLTSTFKVSKLNLNSHLFTSDTIELNFPGRQFKVENSFIYKKENNKKFLEGLKMNITTRNFPESVDFIRKKWKIKEGGNIYTFFTTNNRNEKIVVICSKINTL